MKKVTKLPEQFTGSEDYANLIDLLAVFNEAKQRLACLENDAQESFTQIIDEHKKEYTELQGKITEAQAAIELIATRHPEWFTEKRSVKTPYGTVKVTRTNKLDVPNEEATILLIERQGKEAEEQFIRSKRTLDLEALEKLSDAELKALRISRVRDESVSVKEAKIDLGKAVRAAVTKEEGVAA